MKLPRELGPVHFIGIGGIGMSGIAELLLNLGYEVQGSDMSDNANVMRLRDRGARVFVGHDAAHLGRAAVVVVSTAIQRDNPELSAARERRIPVVRRAEMLAELMRLKQCVAIAGTHGKTTTTSLVAALLEAGGLDPTVINGGIINSYGTNARLGAGDWMVVEADESDGTFLKLPADVAIVTNIDPEHLDHFKTFDAIKEAFRALVENLPFYGFAVMCLDHPVVQELVGRIEDRRVVTYGVNPQADVRLLDVELKDGASRFSVLMRDRTTGRASSIENLAMPMPGHHNALNATAAIAVAYELAVPVDVIRGALATFGGVKRRFTRTGEWNGVQVFDDYGHHPVEIAAVLRAGRESANGKVIAVVQPHRYTRLQSLFNEFAACFNDADTVIVADVYPAGERPIEGVDRDHLVAAVTAHGHRQAIALPGPEALPELVRNLATPGDYVIFLGAGNITQWACALPSQLATSSGDPLPVPPPLRGGGDANDIDARDPSPSPSPASEAKWGRVGGGGPSPVIFPDIVPQLRARLPELRGALVSNPALAPYTWFRVGGPAQVLFSPADEADLAYFLAHLPSEIPVWAMGLGSNLIVRDGGVEGVTVRLGGRGFGEIRIEPGYRLRTGTAVPDVKVARAAADAGVAGLAFYRGIPGSIGGALRMNAGAHGGETTDVLIEARGVDRAGRIRVFGHADMGFGYRHCGAPEDVIFTQALYQGAPGDSAVILAEMDRITAAREAAQPIREKTGGSTFKNPPGGKAWTLIDRAGCRGLVVGDAQVSDMHCNFLINRGRAAAAEIEALGEEVRRRVRETSGVDLQWEIKRVGMELPGEARYLRSSGSGESDAGA